MNHVDVTEAARYFEGIFTTIPEGLVIVDHKGTILEVNRAFTSILGYTAHEIVGKPFDTLAYKNQKMQKITSHNTLHRFYASENKSLETTLFDRQDRAISVRFRSVILRDTDGRTRQAMGMLEHLAGVQDTGDGVRSLAEKMWEAQQNFDNVLNNSADMIVLCDISGNILMANKAFSDLLEYKQEDVKGKHIAEFTAFAEGTYSTTTAEEVIIDKNFVVETASKSAELFARGYVSNWESYLVKKSSVHVPTEITMSLLKDREGNRRGSLVLVRNITERKMAERERERAEKDIREARDFLENIFKTTADGIIVTDPAGYITMVNDSTEKMLGYAKDELIGMHPTALGLEGTEHEKKREEFVTRLQDEGLVTGFEHTWLRKDGSLIDVGVNLTFLKDSEGSITGAVGSVRDITESKKSQKEVKKARDFLESIIENSGDGIVITDAKGDILSVNTALEKMMGRKKKELIGKHSSTLLIEERAEKDKILIKMAELFEKGSTSYETVHQNKEGEIIHVECNTTLIKDDKGNPIAGVSIIRDITERKKMEQKLLQSEKLKSLGELAGGVAHDFNNVLAAILGRVQLLKMQFKPPAGKEEKRKSMCDLIKSLDIIERASLDGAETVRRIQEFSRKRSDDKDFTPIDINELVNNSLDFTKVRWKHDADAKGIEIRIHRVFSPLPLTVGSASELREVFTNLIHNALDAMPKGGQITFTTSSENGHIAIRIEDTGLGIPEGIRNRIFDPFFTTKGVQSTGLGMSISYGIINRHGGTIRVDSTEGKGAAFTITLPISDISRGEEAKRKPLPQQKRKSAILVIEDEEEVRNLLADILIENGHRVETACDGNRGIELFKEKDFDLVFTDLGMPGTSGWEVAEKVKSINEKIPVAIITGWNVELKESEMRERGVNFIAYKPFKIDQILKLVQEGMELRERLKAA